MNNSQIIESLDGSEIAIIGMACRFPGARDYREFWRNLVNGVESITFFTDEELLAEGVAPSLLKDPGYVKAAPVLKDYDKFDADFFGYSPREAELMDPQHRLFIECAWEALENAGYNPEGCREAIGVFAGAKTDTYLFNLSSNRELLKSLDAFQIAVGNDLGCLSTRVSYKLGLKGPSYGIHTACSTSLVAVHLACQSLLIDECRMAIAGGVTVNVPHKTGYLYQPGGVASPDGHCRAFDAEASGTLFGSGVGIVVLKRLEDAIKDGDYIYAVIKGSAANNDGSGKASFTAPGVDGQTQVVLEALAAAGVDADTISYVEAHGTGTNLGDPIEITALTNAFRASTDKKGYCAIGSVKTNIGHLDAAAGISSLIKTALSLKHRILPPSLHYRRPNPAIDFESSPFYVNSLLTEWKGQGGPCRAGVSSFGFGSTNAHVILEEAPQTEESGESRPWQALVLSARTESGLEKASANLAQYLEQTPDINLADAAYTLKVGRKVFEHRKTLVCRDIEDAVSLLKAQDSDRMFTCREERTDKPVVFMFPGQGAQYVNMGLGLYNEEPGFRKIVDRCCEILKPHLELDLRSVLFPSEEGFEQAQKQINRTYLTQAVIFVIEYALAALLMGWGVRPQALIGHSIGEYAAACIAGVLSLEDALELVACRGKLMQELPGGAMISVSLPEKDITRMLEEGLSVATINAPSLCTVSGTFEAIESLEKRLTEKGVQFRRLNTSHAFHSPMMEPILRRFTELVGKVKLSPPKIPYISNVTGTWIKDGEAVDPAYWARHLRYSVRFTEGIQELLDRQDRVFIEVGPGQTLSTFTRQHLKEDDNRAVLASMRHPNDKRPDTAFFLLALGKLWASGGRISWKKFYSGEKRHRIPLTTYPFERQRYWIDAVESGYTVKKQRLMRNVTLDKKQDVGEWFYKNTWKITAPVPPVKNKGGLQLVFTDSCNVGARLIKYLEDDGQTVVCVEKGEEFINISENRYVISPHSRQHYEALVKELSAGGKTLKSITYLWNISKPEDKPEYRSMDGDERLDGFYGLLHLVQALSDSGIPGSVKINVISNNTRPVTGTEALYAHGAVVSPACKVITKEYTDISCRSIDILLEEADDGIIGALASEVTGQQEEGEVAYREGSRWVQDIENIKIDLGIGENILRNEGVYVITGGLGGIGFVLAEYLAKTVKARLVLTGRSSIPPGEQWDKWLESHDHNDSISRKIRKIRALEEASPGVMVLNADVCSREEMQTAINEAYERFGVIHGVIHAAGISGGGVIQLKTPDAVNGVLKPRIEGTLILKDIFEGKELDFIILCASLQSTMGDFGQVDYCGANAFMDALAHRCKGGATPVVAIDWDNWREVGIAAETEFPAELKGWQEEILSKAITPVEGVEVFKRVLGMIGAGEDIIPQVIISAQELKGRLELSNTIRHEDVLRELGTSEEVDLQPSVPQMQTRSGAVLEKIIADIWKKALGLSSVSPNDNFFDIGGNSLSGLHVVNEIKKELGIQITPVVLYEAPTVSALAKYISPEQEAEDGKYAETFTKQQETGQKCPIAIVGMSGRFPGAGNIGEFWQNLCCGKESISFFTREELEEAGVDEAVLEDPGYVRAAPILENVELFDAEFFGYTPREAEIMDPQHRIFLECAWEALEDAGYEGEKYKGKIGVFGGASLSTYMFNIYSNPGLIESVGQMQTVIGNDKDSLTTSVSYKFNLKGPSIAVQTFCSTSLVAVHLACQSLKKGECTMALAGGATVNVPQKSGYMYQEGNIMSPDGHCRPFDAAANGTLFGSGVGVVVLKRLEDAIADGDSIYAVVKGSAINNDGSLKVGYTAPSVEGQAEVIKSALKDAGVDAGTISYIEAHGTGTQMGDPIEVTALTKALDTGDLKNGRCAIGSVKGNVGHLDRAAGVAGFIKTALALKHRLIPPSLNYTEPNPKIDFQNSPFYVNTSLVKWETADVPRRAGISSLGFGGTNVHIILEEPPELAEELQEEKLKLPERPYKLLLLSARNQSALDEATGNLRAYLMQNENVSLDDLAYTLQVGRKDFEYRRALVCCDIQQAASALESMDSCRVATDRTDPDNRSAVFMFPGQGVQYIGMAAELYNTEPYFREQVNLCRDILKNHMDTDLLSLIYPGEGDKEEAEQKLSQTRYSQPAIFVMEYALAKLLIKWGIQPSYMIGHSLGEYTAACISGVMALEDALTLVAARGRMIQELRQGTMLGVPLPEDELVTMLGDRDLLAAVNAPGQCTVSGSSEDMEKLFDELNKKGIECRNLHTSHAFHSYMMEPILEQFKLLVEKIKLNEPAIPYISCVSGTWITGRECKDPAYWADHIRKTVRFSQGVSEILKDESAVLLEVGPGQTLCSLAKRNNTNTGERTVLAAMRHPNSRLSDGEVLLSALGKLWIAGVKIDWDGYYSGEKRKRIHLPTYPFQRKRYWIEGKKTAFDSATTGEKGVKDWFHTLVWKRQDRIGTLELTTVKEQRKTWLLFEDKCGISAQLAARLKECGQDVICVAAGEGFSIDGKDKFTINPLKRQDYERLIEELGNENKKADSIIHLWNYNASNFEEYTGAEFYGILYLTELIKEQGGKNSVDLWVVSSNMQDVNGEEELHPGKSSVLGVLRAINRENAVLVCRSIDLEFSDKLINRLADNILWEACQEGCDLVIAHRGSFRWVQYAEKLSSGYEARKLMVEENGTYLITEGLEGLGFQLADYMAKTAQARLILTHSGRLPGREKWKEYLSQDESEEKLEEYIKEACFNKRLQMEVALEHHYITSRENNGGKETGLKKTPLGLEKGLSDLCASYIYRYLFGDEKAAKGKNYGIEELKSTLGIASRFEKFYSYMLLMLAEDGIIKVKEDSIELLKEYGEMVEPQILKDELLAKYPESSAGLQALEHCARNYRQALSGEINPLSVLYPDGSSGMLMAVTENQDRYSNIKLHQKVITDMILKLEKTSGRRKLRILEIGAGDGKLTWNIVSELRDKNIEYYFTDIGKSFVINGRKKARMDGYGFMDFRVLDISKEPEAQGFNRYSFDVILALDVVHATSNISETMQSLKKLLVPNGVMMLVEATKPQRWVNMIWGLAEGWWYFSDADIRENSPLLSPEKWETVLSGLEFKEVRVYPEEPSKRLEADHSMIVVQQQAEITAPDFRDMVLEAGRKERQDTRERIERAISLEGYGTGVNIEMADISDESSVVALFESIYEKYGNLNGVIHIAGDRPGLVGDSEKKEEGISGYRYLEKKMREMQTLDKALENKNPDFALVMWHGLEDKSAAHSAARAFIEAYAARSGGGNGPGWTTVEWDEWKEGKTPGVKQRRGELIKADEGIKAFELLMSQNKGQLSIVTPQPIERVIGHWNRHKPGNNVGTETVQGTASGYNKPGLQEQYQTETQCIIAGIWQEILGLAQIGTRDNFFEIGGDSLQATQLNSRMRNVLKVELPMKKLFEAPTIEELATVVEEIKAEEDGKYKEEILNMLDGLSEEELEEEYLKSLQQDNMV